MRTHEEPNAGRPPPHPPHTPPRLGYSVEHPLMIRMLHFATILQQVSKNQTVDATYNILEQRAQNHTLDQDLFITAQSAKIIESLLS